MRTKGRFVNKATRQQAGLDAPIAESPGIPFPRCVEFNAMTDDEMGFVELSPGTTRREMRLAEELADIAVLFEPGHARDVLEWATVERWR